MFYELCFFNRFGLQLVFTPNFRIDKKLPLLQCNTFTMFKNKTLRILFFIVLVAMAGSYFAGLTIDVTRDAGKYATVSKEIFQHGNYINITINGEAYDQKPPLLFWLGAAGFSVGGVSNFWFKFPVLLLIFLGFYWGFRLGESLYNKRVGYLTAVMLAFSFIYFMYSSDIHTDTPLQAFVTLALWQLAEFVQKRKTKNMIFGFVGIGLAMLSKGPIGAAIPAFAVVGHILLKRDFKFLFDYRWYLGIVIAFVVASPAMIGLMNQFGWQGIWFFFWENNIGRITGSYVHLGNDPFYYFHNLLYLFIPWSLLFFTTAFLEFKTLVKNRFRSNEYFTLTGIWIFFIILNSANFQLPNYIFSIVPLIAVLTAKWVDISLGENPRLYKPFFTIQNVVVVLLWILIFILAIYVFPFPKWYFWVLVLAAMAASWQVLFKTENRLAKVILPTILAFTTFSILMNTHAFPYMFSFQAPPKAARYFNKVAAKDDVLYDYLYGQYELYFYSEPQATKIDSVSEVIEVANRKGSWIFTNPDGLAKIDSLNIKTDTIIEYRHLYLNRGGLFLNPKTRDKTLKPLYLLKLTDNTIPIKQP